MKATLKSTLFTIILLLFTACNVQTSSLQFTSSNTVNVKENQNKAITLIATSENDNIIYSIEGVDANYFTVNPQNGEVTFITLPDFEKKNRYSFKAIAIDSKGNTVKQDIIISIIDVDENTSSSLSSTQESSSTINFTSSSSSLLADTSNSFSSLSQSSYSSQAISSSDTNNSSESNSSLSSSSSSSLSFTFLSDSSVSVKENQLSLFTLKAQSDNTPLHYSISGDDSASFSLNEDNGTIRFITPPDFETKTTYNFEASVSDSLNNTITQTITVHILDVNEIARVITYFVDSKNGDDTNDGLSKEKAWKSLSKVQSESTNFKAGDVIGFKGDSTFIGTLTLENLKGSAGKPIVFTSYDSGQATITNAINVSSWTNEGNNIWSSTISDSVFQVFKDNNSLLNARSDFLHLNKSGNTNLKSNDLINHSNLVGSYLHVYPRFWTSFTRKVTAFDASTGSFTLNSALNYGAKVGDRFYIVNSLDYMDKQNEWVYKEDESKLYIYSSSQPSNINVATNKTNGIYIYGSDYLELDNLKISKVNDKGLRFIRSHNVSVLNSTFEYCYINAIQEGEYGVASKNSSDLIIKNNIIKNTVSNSIHFRSANAIIENNSITNNGDLKNVTYLSRGTTYALSVGGSNSIIRNNRIENSAYLGLSFYGINMLIEKNIIHNFCMELSDGGAIYTYNGAHDFNAPATNGSIVRNNFISNDTNRESLSSINGIYMDDRTHGVTIDSNHINNVKRGIFLHNTKDCIVKNNTVHGVTSSALAVSADPNSNYSPAIVDGEISGNVITGNTLFMEYNNDKYSNPYDTSYVVSFGVKTPWTNLNLAFFDNNKIYNPYARRYFSVHSNNYYWRNVNFSTHPSFNFWKNTLNNGANSTVQDFAITKPNYITSIIGNELIPNGTFSNANVSDWFKKSVTLSGGNDGVYDYMQVDMLSAGGGIRTNNSQITTVKANTQYEISFDIKSDTDVQLSLYAKDSSSGSLMQRPIWSNAGASWQHYSLPATTGSGNFTNFRVELWGEDVSSYKIANLSLKEVTYTLHDDTPISRYYQNATSQVKTINLEAGTWKDLEGNSYNTTLSLAPYSSIILVP